MLPCMVKLEIEYYKTGEDTSPFKEWFDNLEINAARKVTAAISRMEEGNPGDVKFVGRGIWERRIFYGPGYRIYFGKDGNKVVILLTGGTKKRQSRDIALAQEYWADYYKRKETKDGLNR